ncbi:hypothetical protein EVAR_66105_1 [Eumeta japonica]|uniref:Uncharacterized protein n=1 Tax=Eumeta variegata TaxID=151549 RepID=A0A4C2AA40_EUMVA|nr:hypothetical protein EVAR_66105_1 [Eumeta japonica]
MCVTKGRRAARRERGTGAAGRGGAAAASNRTISGIGLTLGKALSVQSRVASHFTGRSYTVFKYYKTYAVCTSGVVSSGRGASAAGGAGGAGAAGAITVRGATPADAASATDTDHCHDSFCKITENFKIQIQTK